MDNLSDAMKAWAIEQYGDNAALKLMQLPVPEPGDNDVIIQVKAASLNPVDLKIRNGMLKMVVPFSFPLILGNDCSGTIFKIGKNVSKFRVGDEVIACVEREHIGTLCEYAIANETSVAFKPKHITFEEAASFPLVGLTSWQVLLEIAKLKAGDSVFIPAGSGGVGTFAIQLAKYVGAYVITTTSGKNVDFVKSLGADEVIDYQNHDFYKVIKEVDIVYDTMGGNIQRKAFTILKRHGKLVSIVGPITYASMQEINAPRIIQIAAIFLSFGANLRAKFHGATYHFLLMHPDGEVLQKISTLVTQNKIKPIIDKIFSFDKVPTAFAYLEQGHARGKVVISMT